MNHMPQQFSIREALITDIPSIQRIRRMVKENILSNPDLVRDEDCELFITQRGKGWVATCDEDVVGFAIADLKENNIWALFMHPEFEKMGMGKQLHDIMLDWYFEQGKNRVWLSTDPNTRAERFYELQNWSKLGVLPNGEVKFEMTFEQWSSF